MFKHLNQATNRAYQLAQVRLPTPSVALVDAQSVELAPRLEPVMHFPAPKSGFNASKAYIPTVSLLKQQKLPLRGGNISKSA